MECGFKSHLPHHMNTGCNLNKTVRITTGVFHRKSLITGFKSNNQCESSRTVLLQKR